MSYTVDGTDYLGGADQGVLAQVHRCRSGMRLDTGKHQVEPLLAQTALHHTDGGLAIFQHRPLFDMRFEIGADRMTDRRTFPGVTDTLKLATHRQPLLIDLVQGLLQVEFSRENARAHHARGKA
ncbi:hypothetical protein D3C77_605990 [compost metagenome]